MMAIGVMESWISSEAAAHFSLEGETLGMRQTRAISAESA
jgi:hypothetical protein